MQTMDLMPDSDGEIGSEVLNSSQSSMSSRDGSCEDVRCSSFSRLSFDAAAAVPALEQPNDRGLPAGSPVGVPSKPCLSSDLAFGSRSRSGAGRMPPNAGHRDFKLIRRIGSGDIGTVYLCRLREESSGACVPGASKYVYAMKIVDKRALAVKKKLERAATEKRILRALNHPFLPTLYADFDAAPHYSCVVMEYCGGGDLHTLRHRQPGGRFSVAATRFYAAEVLLALEYLHMLGVVYRDLKPENILIRSDGHIMLSDFDLSLESTSTPTVEHVNLSPSNPDSGASTGYVGCTSGDPSCLPAFRARRPSAVPSRLFVAEPVAARSCSFVGTHEYVAPEVAAGRTHGSAVDWWAYGVLLYELLYGRTPFAGPTNEATLRNIIRQPLAFPPPTSSAGGGSGSPDSAARGLIAGLLVKDPAARLGSSRGSADVKGHRFFKGLNFALMRSSRPPFVPGRVRSASRADASKLTPVEFF